MRIPLDYYRILGIPIQVTEEQLEQAYQDRSLQLPRREYSENAIAARKQLFEQAYQVLSDSSRRSEYEINFLEKTLALDSSNQEQELSSAPTASTGETFFDSHTPYLEIPPSQLVGALMILQELGEYEQVIRLGTLYLDADVEEKNSRDDIIFTIALACLELSRELWQERQYEKAADLEEKGLNLIKKENLFPSLQEEIETDFYKLRPYLILQLLSLEENQAQKRGRGLNLLHQMLDKRQGIDGKGNDGSGLNLDDFLRFIQQLRRYLTVQEQYNLFQKEAKRPSSVAGYLKVYTLIARGFAYQQPADIVEAKEMLNLLSKCQDVNLEKAICCLLLGQTDEASFLLEETQEKETLEFIKKHSHGEPDLLPGLCLYGERWLQTEVFSHFRDLSTRKVSLKDYFADEGVQNYLEQLSLHNQEANRWLNHEPYPVSPDMREETLKSLNSSWGGKRESLVEAVVCQAEETGEKEQSVPVELDSSLGRFPRNKSGNVPSRRRYEVSPREYTHGNVALSAPYPEPAGKRTRPRRRRPSPMTNSAPSSPPPLPSYQPSLSRKRKKLKQKSSANRKGLLLGIILLFGFGAFGLILKSFEKNSSLAALGENNLAIEISNPPLEMPSADAQLVVAGALTKEGAEQVIKEWLSSKAQALGSQHKVDKLSTVLADPMLSVWKNRAQRLQSGKSYYDYEHQVTLRSLNVNKANPNLATIEAKVRENAKYYQNGKPNSRRSYNDNLLIRYELVRQNNQWKIRDSQVLSK